MESYWLQSLERSLRKEPHPDVKRTVHIIPHNETWDEFMSRHLVELENDGLGKFTSVKKRGADQIQWRCERANKCKGKSSGDPTTTRANGCGAYVSFAFVTKNTFNSCIVRLMNKHSGHDVNNPQEERSNRIDGHLIAYINTCFQLGDSNAGILLKCQEWEKAQGKMDFGDRQHCITPEDIRLLKKSFHAQTKMDGNDFVGVDRLVKAELKESVVFYQPLSHSEKQPLIIVFSSPWQIEQLKKHGPEMIYLDATYKGITQYEFAFYAVHVKSDQGRGVPVAFFILSEESSEYLSLCLQKLQEAASPFQPRCVMIDRDMKEWEVTAIRNVFPNAETLFFWFHILQAVHRWMLHQEGCRKTPEVRSEVIRSMILLKQCATATDFEEKAKEVTERLDAMTGTNTISKYLQTQWFQHAEMWANYGRCNFHQSSETNNFVESMKYQFLGGYSNRRLDELLLLLNEKVVNYYSYLDLHSADWVPDSRTQDTVDAASRMKSTGSLDKIILKGAGLYSVPSEVDEGQYYDVDVIAMQCQCAVSIGGDLCTHVILAKEKSQEMDNDIDELRKGVARSLFEQHNYEWDGKHLIVHRKNDFGVVCVQAKQCTCLANSLQEICVCIRLSEILLQGSFPQESDKPPIESATVSVKQSKTVKDMMAELHDWCQSSDYKETPAILSAVTKAHQLAFGQYTSNTRKRKKAA